MIILDCVSLKEEFTQISRPCYLLIPISKGIVATLLMVRFVQRITKQGEGSEYKVM